MTKNMFKKYLLLLKACGVNALDIIFLALHKTDFIEGLLCITLLINSNTTKIDFL